MMPVPDQLGRSPRRSSRRFPYSDQDSPQRQSARMSSFGPSVTSTSNPAFQGVNQDISQEEREIRALPQPPSLPQRQSQEASQTIPKQATINKKRRAPQPPSVEQLERIYEEASSVNPYGHQNMTATVAEIHNQN